MRRVSVHPGLFYCVPGPENQPAEGTALLQTGEGYDSQFVELYASGKSCNNDGNGYAAASDWDAAVQRITLEECKQM